MHENNEIKIKIKQYSTYFEQKDIHNLTMPCISKEHFWRKQE